MIAALLYYLFFSVVLTAPPAPADIEYDQFVKIVMGSKSIPEVVAQLPNGYKGSYVQVHTSASAQEASYESPRTIMFGKSAKLIIAVSGLSKSIEIFKWDEETKEFKTKEVTFSDNGRPKLDDSPRSCIGCHGDPPRPKWDGYNFWPGSYCPVTRVGVGGACNGAPSIEKYKDYLKKRPTQMLDKHIPVLSDKDINSLRRQSMRSSGKSGNLAIKHVESCGNGVSIDGSSEMTQALMILNAQRVYRRFRNSPEWDSFKYAFAGSLIGCAQTNTFFDSVPLGKGAIEMFLPPQLVVSNRSLKEFQNETRTQMREDSDARKKLMGVEEIKGCKKSIIAPQDFSDSNYTNVAMLRYMASIMGISDQDWSFERSYGRWDFTAPVDSMVSFIISHLISDILVDSDPAFKSIVPYAVQRTSILGNKLFTVQKLPIKVCLNLATRSKKALATLESCSNKGMP